MKLPIKKKYFDQIKSEDKNIEYRDAHITFVCEETGETLRKNISAVYMIKKSELPQEIDEDLFEDDNILEIELIERGEK